MAKRGQFFLLAAVILSVAVLSFGAVTNKAISQDEPENFYDFTYEVEREVGAVIDYEVYRGFGNDVNLDEFVELLVDDIKERNLDSGFLLMYGDGERLELRSYGVSDLLVDGADAGGYEGEDSVCFKGACHKIVEWKPGKFAKKSYNLTSGGLAEEIVMTLGGSNYTFPISKGKQVVFVMQKEYGGNKYVVVG
jgi:hypothetical protein